MCVWDKRYYMCVCDGKTDCFFFLKTFLCEVAILRNKKGVASIEILDIKLYNIWSYLNYTSSYIFMFFSTSILEGKWNGKSNVFYRACPSVEEKNCRLDDGLNEKE